MHGRMSIGQGVRDFLYQTILNFDIWKFFFFKVKKYLSRNLDSQGMNFPVNQHKSSHLTWCSSFSKLKHLPGGHVEQFCLISENCANIIRADAQCVSKKLPSPDTLLLLYLPFLLLVLKKALIVFSW